MVTPSALGCRTHNGYGPTALGGLRLEHVVINIGGSVLFLTRRFGKLLKAKVFPSRKVMADNEAECLSPSLRHRQPRRVPHSCIRSMNEISTIIYSHNGIEKVAADI
eukprot:jgi/Botrbrau1/14016/Bobra.0310s0003.1